MRYSHLFRFTGSLALFGCMCLCPTEAIASSLTVCGIVDGGPADPDGLANGSISATCTFGGGGSFNGTVTELSDPLNYWIYISGQFHGGGSLSSFVSGQFTLNGSGGLYPFIAFGGQLAGGAGDVASLSDSFTLAATATNFQFGQPSVTVMPDPLGPLPVGLSNGLANVIDGSFNGAGTLTLSLQYSAGPTAYYSLDAVGFASTDPLRVVPEPSTLLPAGCVLVFLSGFLLNRNGRVRRSIRDRRFVCPTARA